MGVSDSEFNISDSVFNISDSEPHRISERDALDDPDYNLVVSSTQTKGNLFIPWLCHRTLFNTLQIMEQTKNYTLFCSLRLAPQPLELVQRTEHEHKCREVLEGESWSTVASDWPTATVELHHRLLASGQDYPRPISSTTGYAGWIL